MESESSFKYNVLVDGHSIGLYIQDMGNQDGNAGLMMGKMAAVINEEMENEPVGTFLCRD